MGVPVEALRGVPLLAGLDDDALAALATRFCERAYDRGAPVVSAGSSGDGFFIVAAGVATVVKGGVPTMRLGKNDCFGEIALIDGGKRSADIVADTNLWCWGISRKSFQAFVKEHPQVAWALLETLAVRLRKSDKPAPPPPRRGWRRRREHAPVQRG